MRKKYTAEQIAEWFLNRNRREMNFEDSEYITNLKLQKLLYYAQGKYYEKKGCALFDDDFQAWEHGPVIKKIYDLYEKNGANGIKYEKDFDVEIDEETEEVLEEVYHDYAKYSAWMLRNMTHSEMPWLTTNKNEIITKTKIKEQFSI